MKKTIYLILVNLVLTCCAIPYSHAQFLDPSFGTGGSAGPFNNGFLPAGPGQKIQSAQTMTLDNNGRILIVGHQSNGANEDLAVMRLNPDGTPDLSYGTNGVTKFNDLEDRPNSDEYGTVIAFNAENNTTTLAGYRHYLDNGALEGDLVVMQLNADGSINNNFGVQGIRIINTAVREEAYSIIFGTGQGLNGIFLGGFTAPDFFDFNAERGRVWRIGNFGSVNDFPVDFANARCHVLSLAEFPGGGLLAAGDNEGGPSRLAIARFFQNGGPDGLFDGDGKAFINVGNSPAGITQIIVQPDFKIVVAGGMFDVNTGLNSTVVARINGDGTVDNGFSGGFRIIPFNYNGSISAPRSIVLQPDGKFIVSGILNDAAAIGTNFGLARLNEDGTIDNNFGTNGFYSFDFGNNSLDVSNSLLTQSDGKLLVGTMSRLSTNFPYSAGLIRLQFTEPAPCSITGLSTACSGLSPVSYTGPDNMNSYSWSVTGNASITTPANQQGINVAVGSSSNPVFTLTLTTTKNGSSTTCSKTVTVTFETCQITGPSTTCGGITTFSGPPNLTFYSWSVQGSGSISGSSGQQTVDVLSGGGSYTLSLAAKGGCNYNCSTNVVVNPAPACNISGQTSVNPFSTGNVYSGPVIPGTYNWSLTGTGGSIAGATNGQTVSVTANASGSFTLRLVTTLNGCTSTINCQFPVTVNTALAVCTYSQDFFSRKNNRGCVNGALAPVAQMMQNAFGANTNAKVFGLATTARFFTLFRTDISNGNIFKMLPGFDGAVVLGQDVTAPIDGAIYDQKPTWPLVPIPSTGMQKGQISNSLLSQLMVLWFNLGNNPSLGNIPLTNNILTTQTVTACGNNTPTGTPQNFTLPQNVITVLSQSSYSKDINGLFLLVNDVLGEGTTSISPAEARDAAQIINNAFAGCRVLTGTSSGSAPLMITRTRPVVTDIQQQAQALEVSAFPNPYQGHFNLRVNSPVSGWASITFYKADGSRLMETRKFLNAEWKNTISNITLPYQGPVFYKLVIGKYIAHGRLSAIN